MQLDAPFESQTRFGDSADSLSFQALTKTDQDIFKGCQTQVCSDTRVMEQSGILPTFSLNMDGSEQRFAGTAILAARNSDEISQLSARGSKESTERACGIKDLRELTNWPELLRLLEKLHNGEEIPPVNCGPVKYRDGIGTPKPNPQGEEGGGKNTPDIQGKLPDWLSRLTDSQKLKELLERYRNGEEIAPIKWPKTPTVRNGGEGEREDSGEIVVGPITVPDKNGDGGDDQPQDMIRPPANPSDQGNNGSDQDSDDVIGQPVKEIEPPGVGRGRELTEAELIRERMKAKIRQIAHGRYRERDKDDPVLEK